MIWGFWGPCVDQDYLSKMGPWTSPKTSCFIGNLGFRVIFGYFLDTWLVKITCVKLMLHLPRDHFLYCNLEFRSDLLGGLKVVFLLVISAKKNSSADPLDPGKRSHRPQDGARETRAHFPDDARWQSTTPSN